MEAILKAAVLWDILERQVEQDYEYRAYRYVTIAISNPKLLTIATSIL
jgi:hypothetical protein